MYSMQNQVLSNRNVIKPELKWTGQNCYRIVGDAAVESKPVMIESVESVPIYEEYEGDNSDFITWNTEKIKEGVFEAKLPVPSVCYGYIIGTKNKTRSEIEKSTNTRINLPGQGKVGNVVVTGSTKQAVNRASERIMWKVDEKRAKSSPTHFICIPCNCPSILDQFKVFKREALDLKGVDELLFQSPMKLHLTIGMLTLLDDMEVEKVSHMIEEMTSSKIKAMAGGSPVTVTLKGVEIMADDPTNANVLYGRVEDGNGKKVIQDIGTECMKLLNESGFGSKCNDGKTIKLHVTLMNSKFKRLKLEAEKSGPSNSYCKNYRTYDCSFNATKILEVFKDFKLGCVTATTLRLAVCGSRGADGAHKVISEHSFIN